MVTNPRILIHQYLVLGYLSSPSWYLFHSNNAHSSLVFARFLRQIDGYQGYRLFFADESSPLISEITHQ